MNARTPAETLRAAARLLTCEQHQHDLRPPHSLTSPAPCTHCGAPYAAAVQARQLYAVAEPLAETLDEHVEVHDSHDCWLDDEAERCSVYRLARALLGEAP